MTPVRKNLDGMEWNFSLGGDSENKKSWRNPELIVTENPVGRLSAERGFVVGVGAHLWLLRCGRGSLGKLTTAGAAEKWARAWGAAASRVVGLVWAHQDQNRMRISSDTCIFIQPRGGEHRVNTGQLQSYHPSGPRGQGRG